MKDIYAGFAERYDLPYSPLDQYDPQMMEFFRKLFAENGVHRVLDCACGTGRHLLMLHDLGCEVYGSDISPSMLDQARRNLTACSLSIPIQQTDFRDLPCCFAEPFDAILCVAAIGYMSDEFELLHAFGSMRAALREGGILILTSMPTDKQWNEKPRFILAANTQAVSRLFVVDYFERTARYNVLDIFHDGSANEMKIWSAELSVFLKDEQERLLKKTGFQNLVFYESYDFKPYEKGNSDLMIVIARA